MTEKGRKPHRITHNISGEPPYTNDNLDGHASLASLETGNCKNDECSISKKPKIIQNLSLNGILTF